VTPGRKATAAGRRELGAAIRRELASPAALADLGAELARLGAGASSDADRRLVHDLLAAKEEASRAAWYVEAAPLWMRKLSWRLIRPLLAVGLLAAVGFSLQREVDPTLGVSLFLFGAAAFYVAVQLLAPFWARADRREQARIDRRYRERLEKLLDEVEEGR
jgi:hypothetical protein